MKIRDAANSQTDRETERDKHVIAGKRQLECHALRRTQLYTLLRVYLANGFRRLLLTVVFNNAVEVMTSMMTMTTTKRTIIRCIV